LSRRRGIELATHLGEPPVYVRAKVAEAFAEGVEGANRGLAELTDLTEDRRYIAVRRTGEHPRGSGVAPRVEA